ncbi:MULTISPECIES: CotH kinase family protein [Paenibacillus]|uniref:CotH kinase family protein n=1 Tax=Paenibacillus TaxID=44249 RepID=UPI00203B3046|nr:CotH kinase family protein [Paenibacillus camelliae]MCM3632369.1 CotH kinase family protein [Paenibacillus camelliae]
MKHLTRMLIFSLLLLAGLLSGCSDTLTEPSSQSIAMISEATLDEDIFPKDQVIDINITVDEEAFQSLLDNATSEEYIEAAVNYNGHLLEHIGLRTKGNSSLRSVASMSDSDRYSFKLSLDEYVTQSIGGITKINLNNEYSDASYIREYIAYEIAEGIGIPTPKYSFVNVYINDELWGLYTAVEQINTAFIEREFPSASGTLYKSNGGDGADLSALGSLEVYTGLDAKHGEANDALVEMTDRLNNGDPAELDQVLDVQAALQFIAFNTVTANMDSYAGNFKHNYYLYEQNGVFTIFPWDLNMAFGGFGGTGILIDEPTGVSLSSRPLIAKLIAEDAYQEEYHHIIEAIITDYFSGDTFENRVRQLQALISEYVKNDPTAFVTFEQFEEGIESLISFAKTQAESITKQLSGEMASYGDGTGSASNGMGGGFGGQRGNRQMPDGMQMPNGMQMPDGMQIPEGMQMPDGIQAPDDLQIPEGMPIPDGFQLPDGMQATSSGDININEAAQTTEEQEIVGLEITIPNVEDGQRPNFRNGDRQQGGGFGGFPGNMNGQASTQLIDSAKQQEHFQLTLISAGFMAIGCLIVIYWRRRKL